MCSVLKGDEGKVSRFKCSEGLNSGLRGLEGFRDECGFGGYLDEVLEGDRRGLTGSKARS